MNYHLRTTPFAIAVSHIFFSFVLQLLQPRNGDVEPLQKDPHLADTYPVENQTWLAGKSIKTCVLIGKIWKNQVNMVFEWDKSTKKCCFHGKIELNRGFSIAVVGMHFAHPPAWGPSAIRWLVSQGNDLFGVDLPEIPYKSLGGLDHLRLSYV